MWTLRKEQIHKAFVNIDFVDAVFSEICKSPKTQRKWLDLEIVQKYGDRFFVVARPDVRNDRGVKSFDQWMSLVNTYHTVHNDEDDSLFKQCIMHTWNKYWHFHVEGFELL